MIIQHTQIRHDIKIRVGSAITDGIADFSRDIVPIAMIRTVSHYQSKMVAPLLMEGWDPSVHVLEWRRLKDEMAKEWNKNGKRWMEQVEEELTSQEGTGN
ncbi:hypothetical protein LOAG_15382 [Loa loa]|uniref:Uncharacterized protein n=1 Tax=Loa loa TaxID=7209 RepID=A0A1S0TFZ1_LOALO|nr:hypothetical protein LOAG_15382 [Loa loa]EFO13148.1 hypothetical protein LOAG_15382 [Loa loa]